MESGVINHGLAVAVTSWLDRKHVVFGRVLEGEDVVKAIEAVGSQSGTPSKTVVIVDSGEIPLPAEELASQSDEL